MQLKQVVAATVVGIGLLGLGFWFGNASASGTEPGSTADPLVSKSYVDQLAGRLAEKSYVDQAVSGMANKEYVDAKVAAVVANTVFKVVNVPMGATLIGESGTELVLRGGKATAVVSQKGGVLDATEGVDLFQDQAVKPNHLLVIPVSDGRGVRALTDLILIVKGPYTVKDGSQ